MNSDLRKLSTRLPWFAEIYVKKLPCIFQATNEVMFLFWLLIKWQKAFFYNYTFILKFEQMYLPEMHVDMMLSVRQQNHSKSTPVAHLCIPNLCSSGVPSGAVPPPPPSAQLTFVSKTELCVVCQYYKSLKESTLATLSTWVQTMELFIFQF